MNTTSVQTIAIVDYGMGNLHSAAKAIEKVSDARTKVIITHDKKIITNADKVVFPGVGAIRDCMAGLVEHDLIETVLLASRNKPFLGICIAMHALCQHSTENGGIDALGVFPHHINHFDGRNDNKNNEKLKVPHMGWSQVKQTYKHPIWQGINDNAYFYFVHSYHAGILSAHEKLSIGTCYYGKSFSAVLAQDNIVAVQFHPEKSADNGLQLLRNFSQWNGET